MATPIAPDDVEQVAAGEALAEAGASQRQIAEAVGYFATDPNVSGAVTAGQSITISGLNVQYGPNGQPQALVAGSALAANLLALLSLPIVGAQTPTPQTLNQLSQRFDGTNTGNGDSVFPTPQ